MRRTRVIFTDALYPGRVLGPCPAADFNESLDVSSSTSRGKARKPRTVVALTDVGVQQLGEALLTYTRRSSIGRYFLAEEVDPAGPYFYLRIDTGIDGEDGHDLELSLPHAFIRFVVVASSERAMGFLSASGD